MIHHRKIYRKRLIRAWLLMIVLSLCSYAISEIGIIKHFGISSLIVAVVLGAFFGNTAHNLVVLLKKSGALGICTKQILRLGVVFYGFRITIGDIEIVGLSGILSAFFVVFSTFLIGYFLALKLGIDKKSAVLISSGSSICGAAAVLATESIVKGESDKVGVAVCTVVIFGTIGMFLYPLIYSSGLTGLTEVQAGIATGISLHEVAHAVAAGNAIGNDAGIIAVIEKMIRVLMLVPFLIFLSLFSAFFTGEKRSGNIKKVIPWFAIWFLVVVFIGSIPFFPRDLTLPTINWIDNFLLCMAMAALGITITKDALKNAGKKPFILAIILFIWLMLIGFIIGKILF